MLKRIIIKVYRSLYFKVLHGLDPIGYAKKIGVQIGKNCRLINVNFGSEPYLVTLGDHVSASETQFITHDGGVWVFRENEPDIDMFRPIKVGNNVFLGHGVIVLPGVTIGDNIVVGAGSIVTKDIPSNSVVAGVPARHLKTLEEYYLSCKDDFDHTKNLDTKVKRAFLEKKFKLTRR